MSGQIKLYHLGIDRSATARIRRISRVSGLSGGHEFKQYHTFILQTLEAEPKLRVADLQQRVARRFRLAVHPRTPKASNEH